MSLQAADPHAHRLSRGDGSPAADAADPRGRSASSCAVRTVCARLRLWMPLLAGVLLVGLTVSLGNWQVRRAQEKQDLQQRFNQLARSAPAHARADAAPPEGQPLRLEGRWLARHTILLDNRTHGGRAGYHVLTPLQLVDGSGAVLVNRGWVAADADRSRLPDVATPAGVQVVVGRMRPVETAPFTLSREAVDGQRWQYLDLERYRARTSADVHPQLASWTVQQTSVSADGLTRDWPLPAAGVDRHRGYALQWYALAGLAGALTAWYAGRLFTRRLHDERNTEPTPRA